MQFKPVLFSSTTDVKAGRDFYENILGLKFISEHDFAIVFEIEGITLRVQKVEQVVAVPYTTLGLEVANIVASVQNLKDKGVAFENYPFLTQDDNDIWTTPDGSKVAWFKDPDGNVLSLSQAPGNSST